MRERQIAGVVIPGEVWAYARLFGVEDHLPAVLETARRAFPGAAISMSLEQQLPSVGFHYLVVEVRGAQGDEQQIEAARGDYFRSVLAIVDERACHFRLLVDEPEAEQIAEPSLEKPATVPDNVWKFATNWRLAKHLLAVLEMTRRVFLGAEPGLRLEDDPEIAGDRYIVLHVSGKGLDLEQALAAKQAWYEELVASCPGLCRYVFHLRLELA
jgi:hypothetical protein